MIKRAHLAVPLLLMVVTAAAGQTPEALQDLDRRAVELARAGKKPEASNVARQALAMAEQTFGEIHPAIAQRLDNLGLLLRMQRLYAEAEPVSKRALAIRERIFGADHPEICQSLNNLAVLYEMQDRLDDVEALLTRALAIRERTYVSGHPMVGQSLHELAKIYQQQNRAAEAQALYDRAVALLGLGHPAVILMFISQGEHEKAARVLGFSIPEGNREAAAAAVDGTFFGKVDALRWTGSAAEEGPDPQRILLRGEATHRNAIWQPFEVDMVRDAGGWKMHRIRALPLPWM